MHSYPSSFPLYPCCSDADDDDNDETTYPFLAGTAPTRFAIFSPPLLAGIAPLLVGTTPTRFAIFLPLTTKSSNGTTHQATRNRAQAQLFFLPSRVNLVSRQTRNCIEVTRPATQYAKGKVGKYGKLGIAFLSLLLRR